MVAGEVSGDLLGADLIKALKLHHPDIEIYGIGGPRMIEQGFRSLYDMERLAVMGLVEVLGRLGELLKIRKTLRDQLISDPPDAFVGIDAPDFNTDLELKLKKAGIPTLHYVSPTVWAWRGYRIKKIRQAVDHMLVVFPFEMKFYEKQHMRATFVGHPAANETPEVIDKTGARKALALPIDKDVIALLPGSRGSELSRHAELFVDSVVRIHARYPDAVFALPFAKPQLRQAFLDAIGKREQQSLPIVYFDGRSREVLAAADVALLASGTAALEAALMRTPMVVTYRMNPLSAWLIKRFAHVKLFSMPNNLAGHELVPEFIQEKATADNLSSSVCRFLEDSARRQHVTRELSGIYTQLRCESGKLAAEAVLSEVRLSRDEKQ